MKRLFVTAMIVLLSACFLVACSNTEDTSMISEDTVSEEVKLDENSFTFKLKTSEYNKDENTYLIEYETGLPDGTVVELFIGPGHPDTWGELYDPYFEYIERQQQQVEVEVYDGLISYLFEDTDFNYYPLMNSYMWITFSIPVTDEVNTYIAEEIASEEDFIEKYPEIHKLQQEDEYSSIYMFFEEENGYDLKFYEGFDMTKANSIEEVHGSGIL
ncbi:hypothetical protein JOC95_000343 [Bacillus tianshenii]|uniref:Lipoprotein n=1 Tax=Sutcliffiella tianshenii TaxID=1463404 RepID=A0ABS2NV34_9BACI|nr:hypothetical protein [Bacillus tianshenii]MBM7618501.1 hypothetical protein [Bacillus tianshenii]